MTRPDHVRHLFRELAVAMLLTHLHRGREFCGVGTPAWDGITRIMADVCLYHVPLFRLYVMPEGWTPPPGSPAAKMMESK